MIRCRQIRQLCVLKIIFLRNFTMPFAIFQAKNQKIFTKICNRHANSQFFFLFFQYFFDFLQIGRIFLLVF